MYAHCTVGAMNKFLNETDQYKIDICDLQEIGCSGKETVIKKKDYRILYSVHKSDKHALGTVFYMTGH
jgi:hypothetical protein